MINHDWPKALQEGRRSLSDVRPATPYRQAVDRAIQHRHVADGYVTASVDVSPSPLTSWSTAARTCYRNA
jgi:hypothetical protein